MTRFYILISILIASMLTSIITIHIITPLIKRYRRTLYKQLFDENGISPIPLLFPYLWEDDIKDNKKIKTIKTIFKFASSIFIVSVIILLLIYANKE